MYRIVLLILMFCALGCDSIRKNSPMQGAVEENELEQLSAAEETALIEQESIGLKELIEQLRTELVEAEVDAKKEWSLFQIEVKKVDLELNVLLGNEIAGEGGLKIYAANVSGSKRSTINKTQKIKVTLSRDEFELSQHPDLENVEEPEEGGAEVSSLGLRKVLQRIRNDLRVARDRAAEGNALGLKVESIVLELEMEIRKTTGGKVELNVYAVEASGEKKRNEGTGQIVRLYITAEESPVANNPEDPTDRVDAAA